MQAASDTPGFIEGEDLAELVYVPGSPADLQVSFGDAVSVVSVSDSHSGFPGNCWPYGLGSLGLSERVVTLMDSNIKVFMVPLLRLGTVCLVLLCAGCAPAGPSEYEKAKAALEVAEADLEDAQSRLELLEETANMLPRAKWPEGTEETMMNIRKDIADARQAKDDATERLRTLSN